MSWGGSQVSPAECPWLWNYKRKGHTLIRLSVSPQPALMDYCLNSVKGPRGLFECCHDRSPQILKNTQSAKARETDPRNCIPGFWGLVFLGFWGFFFCYLVRHNLISSWQRHQVHGYNTSTFCLHRSDKAMLT